MADIKVNIKLNKTETSTQDSLSLDKSWIKNVESISETTNQPNGLFYGVLPNSGNIDVLDLDGTISQYIDEGILPNSNVPADITTNGKQVQKHIINDSTYDINSRTLSVQLTNQLSAWDELQYGGYAYPNENKTAYEMLSHCLLSVGYSEDEISLMLSEIIVYGTLNVRSTVADYLKAITIPYPYLPADTLRNTVDKFCRLAQLQVFVNDNGEIKFVSARPVASVEDKNKSLVLRAKNQKARFEETKILKNKYNAVELREKKVNDETDFLSLCNTYKDNIKDFSESQASKITSNTSYIEVGASSSSLDRTDVWIRLFYMNFRFPVPAVSNMGLSEIKKLLDGRNQDGEPYIKYELVYSIKKGTVTTNSENINLTVDNLIRTYGTEGDNINDSFKTVNDEYSDGDTRLIYKYDPSKTMYPTAEVFIKNESNNGDKGLISKDGNNYYVNLTILVGKEEIGIARTTIGSRAILYDSEAYYYTPKEITISVYGDKRTISFEDISASDANITKSEYVARIDNSELLQQGTMFSQLQLVGDSYESVSTKMSEIIKNNIKGDYANGIGDGKVPVICSDYYNIAGELAKDWAVGQIIEPADCVRVDKDNNGNSASKYKDGSDKFWRVVGRTFSKQGVPKNALSVQEVKFVETVEPIKITYQLTFPDRLIIYSSDKRIYSGDRVEEGQSVIIKSVDKGNYDSITVNYIQANAINVSLNQEIMIKENTTFTVSFDAKKVVNEQFYFDTSYGDVQEIVYNPDDYENAIGFVNIMLADYGSGATVNIPTNGYEEITLLGYAFSVDVDNVSVFIKNHSTLHGMRGEIGTSLKLGTIVE